MVKVVAPGKLVLTGAYAVLEGAPAIVVAVDRCAVAEPGTRDDHAAAEVRAALGSAAPRVDVSALFDPHGRKLGLGSSAAAVVAALGADALGRGEDLSRPEVRRALFRRAWEAHAAVQGGGSGVDIAASVWGGVLRYSYAGGKGDAQEVSPLPTTLAAFFTGKSASTAELRARVDALRVRAASTYQARMRDLIEAAKQAAQAVPADATAFVTEARRTLAALAAMGDAAEAPIVTPAMAELARDAEQEGAAFLPSGAGGGDVAVYLGMAPPGRAFVEHARRLGLETLPLAIDSLGVRAQSIL